MTIDDDILTNTVTQFGRQEVKMKELFSIIALLLVAIADPIKAFSAQMPTVKKGSAGKPFEKKKVAVFGAGGYLGGCIYGFLQRAGSLYGTGIAGIGGPRAITATATGSMNLNSVLSQNFILAQADESFVKLTDMTSVDSIRSRLKGFDAVVMATRYTLEKRPVTGGSYEKTPNDKTLEFFMERSRSPVSRGQDDPGYSFAMFEKSLEACKLEGVERVVVIETDGQFDESQTAGDKYIQLLESAGVPYVYIQPGGSLESVQAYTYAKGIQGDLSVESVEPGSLSQNSAGASPIPREDLAALCVQSILSLDWKTSHILRVQCSGAATETPTDQKPQQQWCVNSVWLESLLTPLATK